MVNTHKKMSHISATSATSVTSATARSKSVREILNTHMNQVHVNNSYPPPHQHGLRSNSCFGCEEHKKIIQNMEMSLEEEKTKNMQMLQKYNKLVEMYVNS